MLKDGLEIERKYLIEYPNLEFLKTISSAEPVLMNQFYINGGGRIRKIVSADKTVYIKTVKQRITDMVRTEKEWEISLSDYNQELNNIKEGTSVIKKQRFFIEHKGHLLEIDVFPFWNDRAFLEIELSCENEEFLIPDFIKIIKEVTFDKRYTNSALAKNIINEEIK